LSTICSGRPGPQRLADPAVLSFDEAGVDQFVHLVDGETQFLQ